MSMSVCIHRPVKVVAIKSGTASWVGFYDAGGNRVDVFCEYEVARATADAFNDAMSEHREAEGSVTAETCA